MTMPDFRRIIAAEYQDGHLLSLTVEMESWAPASPGPTDNTRVRWVTFDFAWSKCSGAWYEQSGGRPAGRVFEMGDLAQRPVAPWLFYLAPGVRCEACDDYLPENSNDVLCEHLIWCDHCGEFTPRVEGARWRWGCVPCRERLGLQLIELDQQLAATPPLEQGALSERVRELRARYAANEGPLEDHDY
jgi:hypothetical protein